jgi:hypothetical protein
VDGTIRVYDTGSSGYYTNVYVRIRTDGWIMAFVPEDVEVGNACWGAYPWILDNYTNRGDLIWWGHLHTAVGNPTADSTTLGKALSLIWDQLKTNSDNPTYTFLYTDVGYYDYEHITSTKIYIFGGHVYRSGTAGTTEQYYYFTIPVGTTLQCAYGNGSYYLYGGGYAHLNAYGKFLLNFGTANELTLFSEVSNTSVKQSAGFLTTDIINKTFIGGVQNEIFAHVSADYGGGKSYEYVNTSIVAFASG